MRLQTLLITAALGLSSITFSQTLEPSFRSKAATTFKKNSSVNETSKSTTPQGEMLGVKKIDTKSTISISATTEKGGTVEMKINAVKMNMSQNGESMSYDSEKPDDGDDMIKGTIEQMMKKPTIINFDAKGIITDVKNSKPTGGEEMEKGEPLSLFLNINKAVKPGDTWTIETKTKETTTKSIYTYKSFNNNEAIVEVATTLKIDGDMDQMGMKMHQTMDGKITSTLTVDAKTLLVKKTSSSMSMNGDVDYMGQKIPVTSFTSIEETVE